MNLAFIEQVIRVEKTMFFSNFNFSIVSRDAHFPSGNRETGNQVPGNFPREMGYREIGKNREKSPILLGKNDPKASTLVSK